MTHKGMEKVAVPASSYARRSEVGQGQRRNRRGPMQLGRNNLRVPCFHFMLVLSPVAEPLRACSSGRFLGLV